MRRISGNVGSSAGSCGEGPLSGDSDFAVTPEELGSATARCDCVELDRGGGCGALPDEDACEDVCDGACDGAAREGVEAGAADAADAAGAPLGTPPLRGGLLAGFGGGATARCCADDALGGSGGGACTARFVADEAVRGTDGGVTACIDGTDLYAPGDGGIGGAATVRSELVDAVRG